MTTSTPPVTPNQYFLAHEDGIFVSDLIIGSKEIITRNTDTNAITKRTLIFNDVTVRLTAKPASGDDASQFQRGDFWTQNGEYMFVRGTSRRIWATPLNDQVSGGNSGATPQQLATIYSRDLYTKNVVFHDSTSAARPNVSNVTALANRQATFDVDGGWTHSPSNTSVYKADIYILASGAGDSNASGFSGTPEALVQGSDGAPGPQGPKGDKGDTGDTGPAGADGRDGAPGQDGAQGQRGPQGIQGIQGQQGIQGEKGDKGDRGEPGTSASGAVTEVRVQGQGSSKQIVVIDGGVNTALPIPGVPSGGNPGDVLTRQAVQGNLWNWVAPTGGGGGGNAATWAQTGNTDDVPDTKISNNFARRTEIEGEIALLEQAIQANVLPEQLRLFGDDVRVGKHPAGVWGQKADSTVGMDIGGAFLVSNDKTTTKGIPQEVAAVSGYSVANLPPAPNPNFVREHADPNEDSNPFLGVTPYCNGPVIVTTPANQRRKVFTGIWGQSLGTRPTDTNLTVENTMFSIGSKGLIRWNRAGIEVRTGADSAINRQVTQYLRIGSQNLSNLGNAAYTPPALASSYTGASQTFRLVANEFEEDESVARQSPSVDVEANASTKGFTIPLNNRAPLTGNITYNGSTRVATINITGGSQAPGSHIELDVRVRNTFTYTRPSRTVYEALVLEDDVVRAGVRDIFSQNHKNVFVFAFEKQYDEDDSNDNIMKLVFRINGITREINLHQTYGELGLGGTEFRIGASLQYVSHIQASTSTEDLGTADLLALDVEQIGWGQLQRNHRDDNVNILAILAAHGFGRLNVDGTVTPFDIPASWAQLGNAQKIPAEKLNLSATNPSGIINPVVLDIQHFDGTTDVDTGRPVDGANSWRSQFQLITFIASYGKGGSGSAAASATPTFKVINIPIDALPANRPAGWERFIEIDSYDGTFEKVGVRVFQPASSNGQANLHFHLYYQNHSPRQIFRAIIPGAIGRFANLRIAQFHDFGGQAYVMPRSAKGEQGDEGPAGPKGDTGANGGIGPKGDKGDTGERGQDGAAGPAGAKGDKGDTGEQGPQGEKGDKGDTGEQGPPGTGGSSRTFSGVYNSALDFNTLSAAGNNLPEGMWSDGTTMWIADDADDRIYAYNLATKARDSAKDFITLAAASNTRPQDLWSDGTTMWVTDFFDGKIYAYNLATKARDPSKDFDTLTAAGNTQPQGIWSDGTTMWVADSAGDKLFAYNMATKARDSAKDFNTLAAVGNRATQGIWSDGTTMWVADAEASKLFAYNLATKAHDSAKDFNTLSATGNTNPKGIWSDGTTMWASDDGSDDKLYAYELYESLGLNQAEVDARVKAGVQDWAETDNDTPIPASKLTNAPSGGGGGTVSGTSGWGTNLLASQVGSTGTTGTVDLSGDVDSILVVAENITNGVRSGRDSVEIVSPSGLDQAHVVYPERGGTGGSTSSFPIEFRFTNPTSATAQIRIDSNRISSNFIVAVYKKTRLSGSAPGGTPGPAGPKGDKGDTGETGPQGPKGDKGDTGERGPAGGGAAIVVNDNYLRLGSFNLDSSTDRGLVAGLENGQVITQTTAGTPASANIRFSNSVAGNNNIPTGSSYNIQTEALTLAAGHWSICLSANLHSGAALDSNIRIYTLLSILQGDNHLADSTLYIRNREGSVLQNIQGKVNVSCVVISDGTTPINPIVTMEYDRTGTGSITIAAASISAHRMLI